MSTRANGENESLLEEKIREPERYTVLLHNDDYTSMDFVIQILCDVFHKSVEEATAIMLAVHQKGIGSCGVYTAEVAEAKVGVVHRRARNAGYPLRCTMEEC